MFLDPEEEIEDMSSYPESKTLEGWKEYKDPLTRAIIFAAEKLDGYCISGTDIPYIMVVLKNLFDMKTWEDKYQQLAGVLSIFPTYKLTTYREIEEIFGTNVGNIIYLDHKKSIDPNAKKPFIKEVDDNYRPEEIPMNLFANTALLGVLAKLRISHDEEFMKKNRKPPMLVWDGVDDWVECDDCRGCSQPFLLHGYMQTCCGTPTTDYDASRENVIRRDYKPWYLTSGYTYVKFLCYKARRESIALHKEESYESYYSWYEDWYEEEYIAPDPEIGYVCYAYTEEYKEYCDRCSEEFWQRVNLTYEEAREKIAKYYPWIKNKGDMFNDFIYYFMVDDVPTVYESDEE